MSNLKRFIGDRAFYKRFFNIVIPVMLQQLITIIVTFADNIMVGSYSNEAVSAVYSANQSMFVLNIACFGIVAGAGIFLQQYYGAQNRDRVRQCFHFKIYAIIILLLIAVPTIYIFGPNLIAFYAKNDKAYESIIAQAWSYLKITGVSYIFFAISVLYSTSLREIGRTKVPCIAAIISLSVNIVFNFLLINGVNINGNQIVPSLGVVGAAYATLLARIIETSVLIIYAHAKKYSFTRNIFTHYKIDKDLLKSIFSKTLPLFANEILWSLGMTMFSLAYSRRENVLSALSIVSTMSEVFNVVFNGLAVGIGVMVGHELGQGKIEKAKDNSLKLIFIGVVFALSLSVVLAALSPVIPYMFTEVVAQQKQLATFLLLSYSAFMWCFAINCAIFIILRAGGKSLSTFIMDSCFMWFIPVPLAWILAMFTNVDLIYIYLIVQACDVFKIALAVYFYRRGTWAVDLTRKGDQIYEKA